MGPLIDQDAVKTYLDAIEACKLQGGKFIVDGGVLEGEGFESGCYVKPCIAEVSSGLPIVDMETFALLLYIMKYDSIEEAIAMQNSVSQGLASSIMSLNMRETELFLSAAGSDCGIANVKRAEAGNQGRMPGKCICGGRRLLSIMEGVFRWRRGSGLKLSSIVSTQRTRRIQRDTEACLRVP